MNNKDLNDEVLLNLNSLVVDDSIGRLVGYSETCEDFYYIVNILKDGKVKKVYHSCVGDLTFVKNRVDMNEYRELDVEYEKIIPKVIEMVVENSTKPKLVGNKYN